MKYEISDTAVKALLQYLSTKPYAEVFQGIQALQSLKPLGEEMVEIKKISNTQGERSSEK